MPTLPLWVFLLCGGVALAFLILGALAAWKLIATRVKMWRLQSNQAMAMQCAAAIARMDFSGMQWLMELPHPSKTQRAFKKVLENLTLIRQYVPGTVLASLVDDTAPAPDGEVEDLSHVTAEHLGPREAEHRGSRLSNATTGSCATTVLPAPAAALSAAMAAPNLPSPRRRSSSDRRTTYRHSVGRVSSRHSSRSASQSAPQSASHALLPPRPTAVMTIKYHWGREHLAHMHLHLQVPKALLCPALGHTLNLTGGATPRVPGRQLPPPTPPP